MDIPLYVERKVSISHKTSDVQHKHIIIVYKTSNNVLNIDVAAV